MSLVWPQGHNVPGVVDLPGGAQDDGSVSFNGALFHLKCQGNDPSYKFRRFGSENSIQGYQRVCRHCRSRRCTHCDGGEVTDMNRVAPGIVGTQVQRNRAMNVVNAGVTGGSSAAMQAATGMLWSNPSTPSSSTT